MRAEEAGTIFAFKIWPMVCMSKQHNASFFFFFFSILTLSLPLGSRVDFSNIRSHEMRSSPSGLAGLAPLLPLRNNEVPVHASELRELLSWTLHEPDGLDGWEKEAVSDLTVYRLTETDEANPGRPVERGRCEVVLDAPIETVFALVDDPKQRATWDDIVGQSMQKYKSRGRSFVSFTLEGLMGLAAENFFLWDAQQAYDRDGIECDTWLICVDCHAFHDGNW